MEIKDGNKLIAEFMGCEKKTLKPPHPYVTYWSGLPDDNGKSFPKIYDMKYHKSWDWLMPVVEKIKETDLPSKYQLVFDVYLSEFHVVFQIRKSSNSLIAPVIRHYAEEENQNLIKEVWKACIKFIKWYNKRQNPLDYTPTIEESPYLYRRKEICK